MNRSLVLAIMAPFLVGPGAASQEPSSVQETAEVVLVEVPVRVTGRDGKPVRNLTAADFQLFDDGKKQEIVGFDAIDLAEKGPAIPGQELNPAARRRFLLLFDLSFSRPRALLEVRDVAKEFVLSGMGDADLAAVATFSLENGLRLILNFSSDRVQLARAIETLGLVTSVAKGKDPLEFLYDVTMLQSLTGRATGLQGGSRVGSAQEAALIETLETFKALGRAADDRYARARIGRLFNSFNSLAGALDLIGGRKDIIYLSEGFESRLLVGTRETEQEKEWITTGDLWKIDSDRRFGNGAMQNQLDDMTALFRRSDCVIHAVDLSGIRTDADVSSLEPKHFDNSLFELAQGTGGNVFRNANSFRTDLDNLIRRTNLVYVLAFRPTRTGKEGRFHELKVKVHFSGAQVSARAGYYERKGFKQLSPLERSLAAADIIANEIPVSNIPLRVLASAHPGEGELAFVPVLIELPAEPFLSGQKGSRASAEIYAYVYDTEKRVRDFFAATVNLDLAVVRERLRSGSLRYYGQLALHTGDYRLRVLVRNAETGRQGLMAETLHVPDFAAKPPYIAQPTFLEGGGGGIFVRGRSGPHTASTRPEALLEPASGELLPTALPELHAGSLAQLSVVAYNFGDASKGTLKIGAHVLSAEGHPVGQGQIEVLSKSAPDGNGKQVLLLAFHPDGLTPGRYALRVFLQDAASGRGGHASTPFVVR